MKNLKMILSLILLQTVISIAVYAVAVYAVSYTDISHQRTEIKIIDDKEVEVNIVTPDKEKLIKKEWETISTNEFSIEDKERELTNILGEINNSVNRYNYIIDELTEVKASLKLEIEIPIKKQITNLK